CAAGMGDPRSGDTRHGVTALLARATRHVRVFPFVVVALAALAAAGWFARRESADISGAAQVIDGDSLVVAGVEIRLYGIDAPEYRQYCFRRGRPWACRGDATRTLRAVIANRQVDCRSREEDRYGRTVASCAVEGRDLGAAMVAGAMPSPTAPISWKNSPRAMPAAASGPRVSSRPPPGAQSIRASGERG